MRDFIQQCIDRYCDLAKFLPKDIKAADAPALDDNQLNYDDTVTPGKLQSCAAYIIMKILWVARVCRYDILYSVCQSARLIAKWTSSCDNNLLRLIGYMKKTKYLTLRACVGDTLDKCFLAAFPDASHADDGEHNFSTSGGFIAIVGPRTFVPLTAICKKQTAVSRSSTEAEMVSLELLIRTEALPSLMFWQVLLNLYTPGPHPPEPKDTLDSECSGHGKLWQGQIPEREQDNKLKLIVLEGNEAVINMIRDGRSPIDSTMKKTHRINSDWIYDVCQDSEVVAESADFIGQSASILTKPFPDNRKEQFDKLRGICGFYTADVFPPVTISTQCAALPCMVMLRAHATPQIISQTTTHEKIENKPMPKPASCVVVDGDSDHDGGPMVVVDAPFGTDGWRSGPRVERRAPDQPQQVPRAQQSPGDSAVPCLMSASTAASIVNRLDALDTNVEKVLTKVQRIEKQMNAAQANAQASGPGKLGRHDGQAASSSGPDHRQPRKAVSPISWLKGGLYEHYDDLDEHFVYVAFDSNMLEYREPSNLLLFRRNDTGHGQVEFVSPEGKNSGRHGTWNAPGQYGEDIIHVTSHHKYDDSK